MTDLELEEVSERNDAGEHAAEGEGTRRFRLAWGTLGLDERTARRKASPEDRLTSRRPRAAASIPPPAAADLPLLTVGSSASDAELVLRTEIGDGGMGVVFSAWQRSLGREVAVKRLVPEAQGDEPRAALAQEARVTGSLEHPNVVPVHALGSDAYGRPVMVMRRVHGTPWGTLLRARRAPSSAPSAPAGDATGAHLEILLQVCNAVRFAHSRGVIHGDLKPDNVMLGAYGEIYVVDWGAALSTRRDDPRGLPFAGDVRTVNGTPAYMAPEMVGTGTPITERTDVYLLGAVLHEILTGAPPHAGDTLYDTMKSAFVSRRFRYPREVAKELAAICHRAMAADPEQRFPDVEAMRQAVAEHIEHRASIALVTETSARVEQLFAALAEEDGPKRGRVIYPLYAECRFGYQQALRTWPGNEEARAGLERIIAAMVSFAVASGDAQAAALLARQLHEPHPELRARLSELSKRVKAEGAELSRLRDMERDLDSDTGARQRRLFIAVPAALAAINLFFAFRNQGGGVPQRSQLVRAIGMPVALVVTGVVVAWVGRRSIFSTQASRVVVGGVLVACFAILVNRVVTLLLRGGTFAEAIATDLLVLAAVTAMIALAAERRFATWAVGFLAAGVLARLFPERAVLLFSISLLGLALEAAFAAFRGRRPVG